MPGEEITVVRRRSASTTLTSVRSLSAGHFLRRQSPFWTTCTGRLPTPPVDREGPGRRREPYCTPRTTGLTGLRLGCRPVTAISPGLRVGSARRRESTLWLSESLPGQARADVPRPLEPTARRTAPADPAFVAASSLRIREWCLVPPLMCPGIEPWIESGCLRRPRRRERQVTFGVRSRRPVSRR